MCGDGGRQRFQKWSSRSFKVIEDASSSEVGAHTGKFIVPAVEGEVRAVFVKEGRCGVTKTLLKNVTLTPLLSINCGASLANTDDFGQLWTPDDNFLISQGSQAYKWKDSSVNSSCSKTICEGFVSLRRI